MTEKQKIFADEYLIDLNATRAYRVAYPSVKKDEVADMKEEIKDLRRRIEKDKRALEKLNKETVIDTVSRGKIGRKSLGTARVEGKPRMTIELKKNAYIKKIDQLERLETDLLEKQTQVEEYIQQMNQIFPQRKIKYTEDNCKQRHKRYFDKL